MLLADLKQKKIAIWGMGKEGQAVLEALRGYDPETAEHVLTIDDRVEEQQPDRILPQVEVLVLSPGVSIYRPEVIQAVQRGVQLTSGSDLFFQELQQRRLIGKFNPQSIAVTGTKGKTTTTSVIAHLLKGLGFRVAVGGNIGVPLISLLSQLDDVDYVVAEISSYQAASLTAFPEYAILLNLYPEHLQWHGTHAQYYLDKCNLLHAGVAIVQDEERCRAYTAWVPQPLYFQTAAGYAYNSVRQQLQYAQQDVLDVRSLQLLGKGNYTNLAAVWTLLRELGLENRPELGELFSSFEPVDHRLKLVAQYGKIAFIDDSISTIPESAINALETFQMEAIVPILGGFDRQQDYTALSQYIVAHPTIQAVITLGSTAERIEQNLRAQDAQHRLTIYRVHEMQEAVQCAWQVATQASTQVSKVVVLLSPGAPSYDMYPNFEARGEDFLHTVQQMSSQFISI